MGYERSLIINFTMLQDFFVVKNVDGVFWTLMIELKFYVLSVLFFYLNLQNKILWVIILFFLLSSGTLVSLYLLDGSRSFGNYLWAYLMLMFTGTSIYLYHQNKIDLKTYKFIIILVTGYFTINFLFLTPTPYGSRFGYSTATLLAIIIFINSLKVKNHFTKITAFLGLISYSFYLIHQNIGYLILDILNLQGFYFPIGQLIVFFIMMGLSYIIYKFIEKPSNQLGHDFAKKI